MDSHEPFPRALLALALAAVLSTVALGVVLRLADPLSSPVIPAEDPYTHMTLVREHLRDGTLDPHNPKGALYPPGLHAWLAAAWVTTGLDLYDVVRLGPAVLGGLGILGVALLLARSAGWIAAFVGALALATAPEMIFRTTMMSPTALDLAILPFFLLVALEVARGRLAWAGVLLPMALFVALAHPWLFPVLGLAGASFAALVLFAPWTSLRDKAPSPKGLIVAAGALGAGAGTALLSCWTGCGTNFDELLRSASGAVGSLEMLLAGVALLAGAAAYMAWQGRRAGWLLKPRAPWGWPWRVGASATIAGALIGLTWLATRAGMPDFVDLPRMFGWPILGIAAAGLVALPFLRGNAAMAGAALFAATFPFVIFNPLDSPYWPHRTAAFLGIALVLLAGAAAGGMVRVLSTVAVRGAARRPVPRFRARPALVLALPAILVGASFGGAVYAGTPDGYPEGWYRLYPPCEFDALRAVAGHAEDQPTSVVITADWEARVVVSAFITNATRVWYSVAFYKSPQLREKILTGLGLEGSPVIVVVDRYATVDHPELPLGFLDDAPWRPLGTWCTDQGLPEPRLRAYITGGGAP